MSACDMILLLYCDKFNLTITILGVLIIHIYSTQLCQIHKKGDSVCCVSHFSVQATTTIAKISLAMKSYNHLTISIESDLINITIKLKINFTKKRLH